MKKIVFFLLTLYFILVPRDALAANVKLPININVSGSNPIYYRYEINVSRLDSHNNVVSNSAIPVYLRKNATLTYDFGEFDDVGEYKYSISLANADNEKFNFDRRNYIVHIQVLTNGRSLYTNTYLEDPLEPAKPASVDFNVKYLVEIKYPNPNDKGYNDGSSSRDEIRQKKNTENNKNETEENVAPTIEIDTPYNKPPIKPSDSKNAGTIVKVVKRMKKAIVKTADESGIEFYITLFIVSICVFILLFFRKRKNHL